MASGKKYERDAMKNACIEYAKDNALKILTNCDFVLLSTEDSDLWEEFSAALSSKRQKTIYYNAETAVSTTNA